MNEKSVDINTLGGMLRSFRRASGLKQKEVECATQAKISKYECNVVIPSKRTLQKLIILYNVPDEKALVLLSLREVNKKR